MRRLPQCSREDADVQLLHADPNSQVLDPRPEEELVAEEWLDDRWHTHPQTSAGSSGPSVVRNGIHL